MNGKRLVWFVLLLALVSVALRSRLRRRGAAGEREHTEVRHPVAVPVAVTRAADPVVVPVAVVAAVTAPAAPATRGSTFGPGSAEPEADGSGPAGWSIKAKGESRLYHTPSSPSWERMHADAWFESEEAAEAAGFRRWDWRRSRP